MNVSHAPPATALPEAPVRAEPERGRGAAGGVGNAARAERLAQRMAPADPPAGGGAAAPPEAPAQLQRAIHGIRDQAAAIQGVHVEMAAERGAVDDVAEAAAGAGEAVRGLASRVTSWVAPTPEYADASVRMPPPTIWDPVFAALAEAERAIAAGSMPAAGDHLRAAVDAFRTAARRYREYRDRVGAGAESATTALQIVEGLGAMAGGALLAPVIASAAGVTSTSLVTGALLNGAGAAATRAVLVGAAEGSRRALGEEGTSAGALLGQVVQEGVTAVVSALFGGAISGRMARALVARAGVRLPAAEAQLLLSNSEHVLVDLASGIGTAPVQAAVNRAMRRVRGAPDPRTFTEEVADELISGAMGGLFFGAMMRRLQGMRLGVREPGERTAIAPPEPTAGATPRAPVRTTTPVPGAQTAARAAAPARAGVGAVEATGQSNVPPATDRTTVPAATADVGAVETTRHSRVPPAGAVEAPDVRLAPADHPNPTQHVGEVARYQRLVVGRVAGVHPDTVVVPDWEPGPLQRRHVRLRDLHEFLRMVATVRDGGERALWERITAAREVTMDPHAGHFAGRDRVNIDPTAHTTSRGRATIAVHEGNHVVQEQAGRRADATRMGLAEYLRAMFMEEAEVHAAALRFAARLARRDGRPVTTIQEWGMREYFGAVEQAKRFGATEEQAHQVGVRALAWAWPDFPTSRPGAANYREAYTQDWHDMNPGRLP